MSDRRRLSRLLLAAASIVLLGLPAAFGQQALLSDQQLRAAFILNFVRYTEWPERTLPLADSSLAVCLFAGDIGSSALSGISGKMVKGHSILVRPVLNVEEAKACHVLVVPEQDLRRSIPLLRALQQQPVLTVSEAEGFVDAGGMIGLVHADNRLQFEVNLGAVQQAQLKASSQLLRLARNIVEARPR